MIRQFLLCTGGILVLSSCSHQYYGPNSQQVPLFTQKNQVQASGYLGLGNQVTTSELHGAYSVTSHFAVMASYMNTTGRIATSTDYMRSNYGEIGAGYFSPVKKLAVFEIYGGMGLNGQHHQYDSLQADLRFTRYFIQPVFGLKTDHFQAGVSFRTSYVNFTSIRTNDLEEGQPERKGYLFFEPALTLRVGSKNVKFQFQRQFSTPIGSRSPSFYYCNSLTSLGIIIILPWNSALR
jgi:hypothetical protein